MSAAQNEPRADESAALLEPFDADTGEPHDAYGRRKVACEHRVIDAFGPTRSLIARSGFIGGPGDTTTRSGYWPLRFAVSDTVIVPDDPSLRTQLVDIRDMAGWLLEAADDEPIRGVANVSGVVAASREWLLGQGVEEFAGPKSMPLWLADPGWRAFMDRSIVRAKELGLILRPLEETLADALA
jgi:2'-hydroxyisoflavone reductase